RARAAARSDAQGDSRARTTRHDRAAEGHAGGRGGDDGRSRRRRTAARTVTAFNRYFFSEASRIARNSSPAIQFGISGAFAASHPSQNPSWPISTASDQSHFGLNSSLG